jgi:hypothetical protein
MKALAEGSTTAKMGCGMVVDPCDSILTPVPLAGITEMS